MLCRNCGSVNAQNKYIFEEVLKSYTSVYIKVDKFLTGTGPLRSLCRELLKTKKEFMVVPETFLSIFLEKI